MNVKLPANITCSTSRSIAGTQVTSSWNEARTASFPPTYSARVNGLDR